MTGTAGLTVTSIALGGFSMGFARNRRIKAVVQQIAASSADVVLLQDVWLDRDWQTICKDMATHLPYAFFAQSGALGGNVGILSRWPIADAHFVPYASQGNFLPMLTFDFLSGRGVLLVHVKGPQGPVVLLNTTLSRSSKGAHAADVRTATRLSQSLQLADALASTSAVAGSKAAVVAGGLMHCKPNSVEARMLEGMSGCALHQAKQGISGNAAPACATFLLSGACQRGDVQLAAVDSVVHEAAQLAIDVATTSLKSQTPTATLQEALPILQYGQRMNARAGAFCGVLGLGMTALGIACILVAGSLPVNNWQITIAGYVVLTTAGTLLLGFSGMVAPVLASLYKREAAALKGYLCAGMLYPVEQLPAINH